MRNRCLLRLSLLALLGLAGQGALYAQSAPQTPSPIVAGKTSTSDNLALRQETFELVWRTVNEKHFDPTFGGVNWQQVHTRYAPKIAAAQNDTEFYDLLRQMLGELHQSHFGIIPPDAVVEEEHSASNGTLGLEVRLIGQQAVISHIAPDSAAARAGLRTGFVIQQINDTPVAQLAQRLSRSTESETIKRLRLERMILARVNGAAGTAVKLSYLDGGNQPQQASLVREHITGEWSPAFGNLPPQLLEFEAKRLPSGYGYIRFNVFVIPMMEKIRAALREMKDAPGIIFDLRGNPGGIGGMASGIGGHLFTQQTSLGRMQMRAGYQNFAVTPQSLVYSGPLAIILDGGSASTSEVFASGMQELGRAIIVGERSAGAALPSIIQKLPTGALFQYAIGDFKTPKGTLIEGRGVIPDVPIKLTRADLLAGRDASLDAAVLALQKRARAAGK
jgi:carboxyl-terminal processing protease